jgi:hypothetical protein
MSRPPRAVERSNQGETPAPRSSDVVPRYRSRGGKTLIEGTAVAYKDERDEMTRSWEDVVTDDMPADLVHHPIKEGWKFLRLVQCRQFSIPYLRYAVLSEDERAQKFDPDKSRETPQRS